MINQRRARLPLPKELHAAGQETEGRQIDFWCAALSRLGVKN